MSYISEECSCLPLIILYKDLWQSSKIQISDLLVFLNRSESPSRRWIFQDLPCLRTHYIKSVSNLSLSTRYIFLIGFLLSVYSNYMSYWIRLYTLSFFLPSKQSISHTTDLQTRVYVSICNSNQSSKSSTRLYSTITKRHTAFKLHNKIQPYRRNYLFAVQLLQPLKIIEINKMKLGDKSNRTSSHFAISLPI